MNQTPFEKASERAANRAFMAAAINTATEMVKVINESEIQVQAFKDWISDGEEVTDIERDLVYQALKDADVANKTLATIAALMEEKFGICA